MYMYMRVYLWAYFGVSLCEWVCKRRRDLL